jgi:hypothetical protein
MTFWAKNVIISLDENVIRWETSIISIHIITFAYMSCPCVNFRLHVVSTCQFSSTCHAYVSFFAYVSYKYFLGVCSYRPRELHRPDRRDWPEMTCHTGPATLQAGPTSQAPSHSQTRPKIALPRWIGESNLRPPARKSQREPLHHHNFADYFTHRSLLKAFRQFFLGSW